MIYLPQFWRILLPVVLFSFAIPGLLIFMLYRMKIISDLSLKHRRERIYPYLITLISYSAMIVYYFRIGMPMWFLMIMAASVAIMVIAILITLAWKISAHMFGVGTHWRCNGSDLFRGTIKSFFMFISLFIIAGLVGTSRYLAASYTEQVIAGFLGFLMCSYSYGAEQCIGENSQTAL